MNQEAKIWTRIKSRLINIKQSCNQRYSSTETLNKQENTRHGAMVIG